MLSPKKDWTESEVEEAIDLYVRTPFGRIHMRNPDVLALAAKLDRTPGSIALKMANLASLDESLDRKGMANASKLDRKVWGNFFEGLKSWGGQLSSAIDVTPVLGFADNEQAILVGSPQGINLRRIANVRQGQDYFRRIILSSYDERCAITGIKQKEFLVAGHIKSWALDPENRMNPRNGICLNRLHDKAFEEGLFSIQTDGKIEYSRHLLPATRDKMIAMNDLGRFQEPRRFKPDPAFLEYHRDTIFQA